MRRYLSLTMICYMFIALSHSTDSYAQDWKAIAENMKIEYRGKIVSIEQLNSSTCWAVLSSSLSNNESIRIAENIGYYIRNSTGGIRGSKPSIHVFKGGRHIAIARPSGMKYVGKLDLADWDTSSFQGEYRP